MCRLSLSPHRALLLEAVLIVDGFENLLLDCNLQIRRYRSATIFKNSHHYAFASQGSEAEALKLDSRPQGLSPAWKVHKQSMFSPLVHARDYSIIGSL